ncbi:MAG: DNA-binding protein [wastewater metagenome]|nr:DNA-binding protein [Candidatus Loosdrechtia aerotolerans]
MNTANDDGLLNTAQAAELLNVSPSTIYAWTMRRTIPHFKLGHLVRFRRSDLIEFAEQNRVEPIRTSMN